MANGDVHTLHFPQPTIKVSVEFYDDAEKAKFLKYPTAPQLLSIVKDGIEIPTEEFLTYYLFHKKRPGKPGWRDYNEVGAKISRAISELTDWVDFNGTSISTPGDVGKQEKPITERIGESIGMSVVNRIHGLSAADWDRVSESSAHKTFDYQIASDGQYVVQMEAKGSSVRNNQTKQRAGEHKRDIHEKKERIAEIEFEGNYPHPAGLRYGVITLVGENSDAPVRALLVDPPSNHSESAAGFRLVQRMRFLTDWVSFISPRSQFSSALQTRVHALEQLPDPFRLAGVPLMRGNGEPFDFQPSFWGTPQSNFFSTKAKIEDGPAGGVVVPLTTGGLFFLGIRESLLKLAADQSFERILDFRAERGSLRKIVNCHFTERAFRRAHLPSDIRRQARHRGSYYLLRIPGEIHYDESGILFGVLPISAAEEF